MESTAEQARCPECGLSLPDAPDQRDKRCPECLRVSGEAVLMEPVSQAQPVAH
jgi:protein-arginine kinase activator protein McsA